MLNAAGRVCGIGVTLPDLWRTRAPVGVEQGVDLTLCNAALGALAFITHPQIVLFPIKGFIAFMQGMLFVGMFNNQG